MFCEESFGSEICRAFRERVGLWILSLKSADYFGRSEYFSSRKKQNLYEKNFNDEANPSGVVNFHSMQMSFAISMHACILFVMIGMTRHVHHFLALWQWCNFELRPLIFVYFSRVLNQSRNKSSNIYDIKSKYPEEYSTVDKVGREKLVGRKSCFV